MPEPRTPLPHPLPNPPRIAPSLLSADFTDLGGAVRAIDGAELVHVDVMDNHFVPNLTIGRPVVEALAKVSAIPLDVHLMIDEVDRWAPSYADAGAASVTFHLEASAAPVRTAREIRARGAKAAVGIRPATPVEACVDLFGEIDMLLVMTVEPGFGGQEFLELCLPKIRRARQLADAAGGSIAIEVDGGVSEDTIEACAAAGADTFVAGSAVFGADDPAAMIRTLRGLASASAR